MYEKTKDILDSMNLSKEKIRKEIRKISWDHTFLYEAILWSSRSHDAETKCGCVLARHSSTIGTGYNGFISEIDDTVLPNVRPFKYPFFLHAEHNAILNCARFGVKTSGATAYITGMPCNDCLQYLWQAGICRIVYTNFSKPRMIENEEFKNNRKILLELMSDRIIIDFIPYEELL